MLDEKRKIVLFSIACLLLGSIFTSMMIVKSESTTLTLIDEGFEEGMPLNWTNTGWTDSLYGSAHSGNNWSFSWAMNDTLTTPLLTFYDNTELKFWYAAEVFGHPMEMHVLVDSTVVWYDYGSDGLQGPYPPGPTEGFNHTEYVEAVVDLSTYDNGEHTVSFVGLISDINGQILDDIIVTTIKNSDDTPVSDDDSGGNGGTTPPPVENQAPIADCDAQEPYQCVLGETILFDASSSSDDGTIVKWSWEFGDNTTGEGETISHEYLASGEYAVICTVTDNQNSKDSCETIAAVFQQDNIPPIKPIIDGVESIDVNEAAIFYVSSTDEDNDTVCYYFDWGDNTSNVTDFYIGNKTINIYHSWDTAGMYDVVVYSKDEFFARSTKTHKTVLVDVNILQIDDEITGYLIDYHKTKTYTMFYNEDTGVETMVKQQEPGEYLIDEDGDDQWDYLYSIQKGLQVYGGDVSEEESNDESESPGFELLFVVLAVLSIQFLLLKKRKIQ